MTQKIKISHVKRVTDKIILPCCIQTYADTEEKMRLLAKAADIDQDKLLTQLTQLQYRKLEEATNGKLRAMDLPDSISPADMLKQTSYTKGDWCTCKSIR